MTTTATTSPTLAAVVAAPSYEGVYALLSLTKQAAGGYGADLASLDGLTKEEGWTLACLADEAMTVLEGDGSEALRYFLSQAEWVRGTHPEYGHCWVRNERAEVSA